MEDDAIPSISAEGTVGSRFVSEKQLDAANAVRNAQWKAAYARLGQEPPTAPQPDVYDGRSLAEKLAANKVAKQEEWEEKTKLANQFRALEEDEVLFLDTLRNEEEMKERKRKREDDDEVKDFKDAIAARSSLPTNSSSTTSSSGTASAAIPLTTAKAKVAQVPVGKKNTKNILKGVVIKKKKTGDASTAPSSSTASSAVPTKGELQEPSKRRKVSSPAQS